MVTLVSHVSDDIMAALARNAGYLNGLLKEFEMDCDHIKLKIRHAIESL